MNPDFRVLPVEASSPANGRISGAAEDSSFLINAPGSSQLGSHDQDKGYYQCHRCGKAYTRQDHIKRHYRSREHSPQFML